MGDVKEVKHRILSLLKTLDVCIPNTMETQWTVRCPYCGDSKDASHGHLSIKIDLSSDDLMVWRCFKCNASGIVNDILLKDLGLYLDSDDKALLKSSLNKVSKFNKFLNDYIEKIEIPQYNSELAVRNLEYINKRLGTNLTLNDAYKYNMILDLHAFMKHNFLKSIPNVSDKMLNFIAYNYVGFLTANKNTLVFRLVSNITSAKRYLKYKINPLNMNPSGFYSIPQVIDILSNEHVHVHIAEGIFDILSIYQNLYSCNSNNERNLFFASCGFGPMTIMQYLVYSGIGSNIILHNYCDNDKTDEEVLGTIYKHEEMVPWCKEIYFHRNGFNGEKDFGVPIDRIIDSKRRIFIRLIERK